MTAEYDLEREDSVRAPSFKQWLQCVRECERIDELAHSSGRRGAYDDDDVFGHLVLKQSVLFFECEFLVDFW